MAKRQSEAVQRQPWGLPVPLTAGASDGQLLARFTSQRDELAEVAFAALVRRHGPMVLHVCQQILSDRHAAEDAFQATFLVLARRAGSIGQPELLGNWLYGVALRTAREARMRADRRRRRESSSPEEMDETPSGNAERPESPLIFREEFAVLHEEVSRLPEQESRGRRALLAGGADVPGGRAAAVLPGGDDRRAPEPGPRAAPSAAHPTWPRPLRRAARCTLRCGCRIRMDALSAGRFHNRSRHRVRTGRGRGVRADLEPGGLAGGSGPEDIRPQATDNCGGVCGDARDQCNHRLGQYSPRAADPAGAGASAAPTKGRGAAPAIPLRPSLPFGRPRVRRSVLRSRTSAPT